MRKITLYRAADDDSIGTSASFAEDIETAIYYLDNPGHGGSKLFAADVIYDPKQVLDLTTADGEEIATELFEAALEEDRSALEGDTLEGLYWEWDQIVPRGASVLRDAGYEWALVPESYPENTTTWVFVGWNDPDLVELDLEDPVIEELLGKYYEEHDDEWY
jgi:hypothetical protein